MDNKRIASELKRVANDLVLADGIANTAGEYENFTGTIEWGDSHGQVTRATFELDRHGIVWKDGTWENGVWENGI